MSMMGLLGIALVCYVLAEICATSVIALPLEIPLYDAGKEDFKNSLNHQAQRNLEANLRPDQKRQLEYIRNYGNTYTPDNTENQSNRFDNNNLTVKASEAKTLRDLNVQTSIDFEKSLRLDKDFDEISKGLFRPRTSNKHKSIASFGYSKPEVPPSQGLNVEASSTAVPLLSSEYLFVDNRDWANRLPSSKIVISLDANGQNSKSVDPSATNLNERIQQPDSKYHITNGKSREELLYPAVQVGSQVALGSQTSVSTPAVDRILIQGSALPVDVKDLASNVYAIFGSAQMRPGSDVDGRSPGRTGVYKFDGPTNYPSNDVRPYSHSFEVSSGSQQPLLPRVELNRNIGTSFNADVSTVGGGTSFPRVSLDRSASLGNILTLIPSVDLKSSIGGDLSLYKNQAAPRNGELNHGLQLKLSNGISQLEAQNSYPPEYFRSYLGGVGTNNGPRFDSYQPSVLGVGGNTGSSMNGDVSAVVGGINLPRVQLDRSHSLGGILGQVEGNLGSNAGTLSINNNQRSNFGTDRQILGSKGALIPRSYESANNGGFQVDSHNGYPFDYVRPYVTGVDTINRTPIIVMHKPPLVNTAGDSVNADVSAGVGGGILPKLDLSSTVGGLLGGVGSLLKGLGLGGGGQSQNGLLGLGSSLGLGNGNGGAYDGRVYSNIQKTGLGDCTDENQYGQSSYGRRSQQGGGLGLDLGSSLGLNLG